MQQKPSPGIKPSLKLNVDQQVAYGFAQDDFHKFHLFYGGGGSGKSFFIMSIIILRAIAAPGSRHGVFRLTRASCEKTLFDKTLREVMAKVFPGLWNRCKVSLSDLSVTLPATNGLESVIYFDGLDENRLTKVLGDEYNTVWLNECNEFGYKHVSLLTGRLRYKSNIMGSGAALKNKAFFDCNPRSKKDWDYQSFILGVNPIDGNTLDGHDEWVACKLNPQNNVEHLGEDYLRTMASSMSAADRKRYIAGEWANDNPGALFKDWMFNDPGRRIPIKDGATREDRIAACPELGRIVVAVDPSTTANKNSDETGICVVGLGKDGHCYVLEDATLKGTPKKWADRTAYLYSQWKADRVVAEKNQGGLMVEQTLRTAHANLPIKLVHATKGKDVRAEPVSALYEQGKVHHVGKLSELEEQMCDFGMAGVTKSPDRMDALVWGVWELMNLGAENVVVPGAVQARSSNRRR